MSTRAWTVLALAVATTGCRVDLDWSAVPDGDRPEGDEGRFGPYAVHSTATFFAEHPRAGRPLRRWDVAVVPAEIADVQTSTQGNELVIDLRFQGEGRAVLEVRRALDLLADEQDLEVARATGVSLWATDDDRAERRAPLLDRSGALHLVGGEEHVPLSTSFHDDRGRTLIARDLLRVEVGGGARIARADDDSIVLIPEPSGSGELVLAAGPDVLQTIPLVIHHADEIDRVDLEGAGGDPADTRPLVAIARIDGQRVLGADITWYVNHAYAGRGPIRAVTRGWDDKEVFACVGGRSGPRLPGADTDAADTDAPDTDPADTDAPDTDPADTDPADTDAPDTGAPAETDALGSDTDAGETDGDTDAGPWEVGVTDPAPVDTGGEPWRPHPDAVCGRSVVAGLSDDPWSYTCGCGQAPAGGALGAAGLGLLLSMRRRRTARVTTNGRS